MVNYSFIIPHKNCPDLLKRCVDSIPERDDVEIILVDDNSDEEKKPSLVRKNLEKVYLDSSQSKGAGRARNVGLRHAKGKWLLFPDSDDYYNDCLLEALDRYCKLDYDVIYFNFEYRDGITGNLLPDLNWKKYIEKFDNSTEALERVKYRHNVPWTKMARHDYLTHNNILFEEVPNGNDILFSMMVGYHTNKVAVDKQCVYVYLRNENSILTKKLTADSAICKITHIIKKNALYKWIHHSEWCESVFKMCLYYTKLCGIPFFILLVLNSLKLYKQRNEWVKFLNRTNYY